MTGVSTDAGGTSNPVWPFDTAHTAALTSGVAAIAAPWPPRISDTAVTAPKIRIRIWSHLRIVRPGGVRASYRFFDGERCLSCEKFEDSQGFREHRRGGNRTYLGEVPLQGKQSRLQ